MHEVIAHIVNEEILRPHIFSAVFIDTGEWYLDDTKYKSVLVSPEIKSSVEKSKIYHSNHHVFIVLQLLDRYIWLNIDIERTPQGFISANNIFINNREYGQTFRRQDVYARQYTLGIHKEYSFETLQIVDYTNELQRLYRGYENRYILQIRLAHHIRFIVDIKPNNTDIYYICSSFARPTFDHREYFCRQCNICDDSPIYTVDKVSSNTNSIKSIIKQYGMEVFRENIK